MRQTAVEWLVEQITNGTLHTKELISQAKEMEKQQIIEAHGNKLRKSSGAGTSYEYWVGGIDYYNETFKS
jgi:hypothetical protein